MQVTETTNDGLRREFRVVVPATDLETRVIERLTQMKDQVRINGFVEYLLLQSVTHMLENVSKK